MMMKKPNLKRLFQKIDIVIFSLLVGLPIILSGWHLENTDIERLELRKPAEAPKLVSSFSELRKWPSQAEAFLNDHFGGRNQLIRFNSLVRYAFGISGSPEIDIGREGWLFLKKNNDVMEKTLGRKIISKSQLDQWASELKHRASVLNQYDCDLVLVIVPNKHTVYREYLPDRYTRFGPTSADLLTQRLARERLETVIDLRPVFTAAKKKGQLFQKRGSHWNDNGALLAYRTITKVLLKNYPLIHILAEEDLSKHLKTWSPDNVRLLGLSGILEETTPLFSVISTGVVSTSGKNYRIKPVVVKTQYRKAPRALVLCDSFGGGQWFRKFIQESFSVTVFRHHRSLLFPVPLIKEFKPDILLYIIVERLIPFELKSN
jgi:hypothetical protein